MKKIVFFILLFVLMPFTVLADFHTSEGYDIPEENYQKLKNLYNDVSIYMMPYEKYVDLMSSSINFDNVQQTTKYVYSLCDNNTGHCENMEITEEEYETGNVYLPVPYQSDTYSTAAKMLKLSLTPPSDNTTYFTLNNIWSPSLLPKIRSFDVMGIRIGNFEVVNGSQSGIQIYQTGGEYKSIRYAPNGTNISNQKLGFGISMNIVNDDITYLQSTIEGYLQINATPAVIYGSYQHAVVDVDLATSKSYTISSGGLGSVLKFSSKVESYYDKMGGTYLDIISL